MLSYFAKLSYKLPRYRTTAVSIELNQPPCCKAMKMYLLTALCLLGFLSAQEVTELTSCLTKEKNLRMDCKYTLTDTSTKPTCDYKQGTKVMGSTDTTVKPDSTFKNRANVTLMDKMCRLSLTGFSESGAKNYTCIIKQKTAADRTALVDGKALATCSAFSTLLQTGPALLTVMLLPLLLYV
ncbi:hypothetical protein AAFF_G00376540 [Aldrovandia affinis]|uniref:Uncharacterized protein n=1 Tax=Aldrovandia affinis TaxID=143900 RepID=A0AAD7WM05_9TELE|nr:hypothetical protein AAFF_G00376540 [Aldrovandia affinis]